MLEAIAYFLFGIDELRSSKIFQNQETALPSLARRTASMYVDLGMPCFIWL